MIGNRFYSTRTLSRFFLCKVACLAILFGHSYCFSQDIHFNLVTGAREEGGGSVAQMAQDAQGFLWLATEGGLFKYDGNHYTAYHYEKDNVNTPAAVYIRCVIADRAGLIWLAPHKTGLDRLDPATGKFTHFRHNENDPSSLGNDTVWAILQDHYGVTWVGTAGGLDKYDSSSGTFIHYRQNVNDASSLSCNVVRTLYEDKQGVLWVGTGNPYCDFMLRFDMSGGLNRYNRSSNNFTRYVHEDGNQITLADNRVLSMFEDSRGIFWVGTAGDGLHTMNRTTGIFERHSYDSTNPHKLSRTALRNLYAAIVTDYITFITEDNNKRIWIGTLENGINVYDPSTGKTDFYGNGKDSKQPLKETGFWMAHKSRDNVLWVSEYEFRQDLHLYKIKPFRDSLNHVATGRQVYSLAEDAAGELWYGTTKGLMHVSESGNEEVVLKRNNKTLSSPFAVYIEKDSNQFWLSTAMGLCRFDPRTREVRWYNHVQGDSTTPTSDTTLVKMGVDGQLWLIGGPVFKGGFDVLDTKSGKIKHLNNVDSSQPAAYDNMLSMIPDKKHHVWIATNRGIWRFDANKLRFKRYLPQVIILSIKEDNEGEIWAGTEIGLSKYDSIKDDFVAITDPWGMLSGNTGVTAIAEDQAHNLWLSTVKGIIRFNKQNGIAVLFGINRGVDGSLLNPSILARSNGNILFSDNAGYFEVNPSSIPGNELPPSISINNFFLNNVPVVPSENGILTQPVFATKKILLNYNQNSFSFNYSVIDFIGSTVDNHLLYRMDNYDEEWRQAGNDNTAFYFNLQPGKYVFRVKALNPAGISAEKNIEIVVSPPWWQTGWTYSIFALIAAAIIWSIIAYRSRQLLRRNKVLEKKVEVRTAELQRSLKDLKDAQVQLVQSAKMASLGELTAGIAHEIQNPLNFVNNFSQVNIEFIEEASEELKKGNSIEVISLLKNIKENEEKIIQHGKRADSIVKGMLQHSRTGSMTMEPTDINSLAEEYLSLAYHGFKAKEKGFSAELRTDFDSNLQKVNTIPQELGRVLLNIYNNSFFAINEKLKQASPGYTGSIFVKTSVIGSQSQIIIHDNGTGIPQVVIDKIFQPFFTTKAPGQGTGLGLSLSYDIIHSIGGKITVQSVKGEYTEFKILLPKS